MIISHKHRYIFLHVPKTAGSSVTVYLSRFLGPDDVQLGSVDDCIRVGVWPNRRTLLDYLHPKVLRGASLALCRGDLHAVNNARKHKYRALSLSPHMLAEKLEHVCPDEWANYYKFCFVRNPWERLVSLYLWVLRDHEYPDFLSYLKYLESATRPHQGWPAYALNGVIAADFVGRYEKLTEDMAAVCERIGLPFDPDRFPVAKKNPTYDYRDYYGPKERKIVERMCAKEIEVFGYEF